MKEPDPLFGVKAFCGCVVIAATDKQGGVHVFSLSPDEAKDLAVNLQLTEPEARAQGEPDYEQAITDAVRDLDGPNPLRVSEGVPS